MCIRDRYNRSHSVCELTDAFAAILERRRRREKPEKKAFYGIVGREKVSVDDMVEKVCKMLYKEKRLKMCIRDRTESPARSTPLSAVFPIYVIIPSSQTISSLFDRRAFLNIVFIIKTAFRLLNYSLPGEYAALSHTRTTSG